MGDVNGDGVGDFIYLSGGKARLVLERASGTWAISQEFTFAQPLTGFVSAAGDVNADGLDDILFGTGDANGDAYVVLGASNLATYTNPPTQTTLTGVAAAASAPYAVGADLNCDKSSDLLLVPQSTAQGGQLASRHDLRFGKAPFVPASLLPQSSQRSAVSSQQSDSSSVTPDALAVAPTQLYPQNSPVECMTCDFHRSLCRLRHGGLCQRRLRLGCNRLQQYSEGH